MSQLLREYCLYVVLTGAIFFSNNAFTQDKDIDDVKKHAQELFESQNYLEAKDLYAQLVSLYPKDENYNYRFGACMLFVDVDKTYPLKFLEFAVSKPNVDIEAFYFLGKGYHYNYRFDEAIVYFKKYQSKLDIKAKRKLPAKQDIRYCENGKSLMKNISSPFVIQKKKVNESDFFVSVKLADIGGRILFAPTELHTATDKKMGYSPVMYKNNESNVIWYTSYGPNEKNGIDIYSVTVSSQGDLGKPVRLPATINTEYDEGFPFVTKDGSGFYFSSKGHNSMGGYDLFRADFDTLTYSYGQPVNMDYSINTPDDDYLYAELSEEGIAFFASNRNCEKGKVFVYKINATRENYEIAVLAGKFDSKDTRSSKITVEDLDKHVVLASFSTDKKSGEYVMRLRSGGKYNFLIEPYGSDKAYQGRVEIPKTSSLKLLKQEIEILVDENGGERLIIRNLFEEEPAKEDANIIALALLEQADIEESKEPEITISAEDMISEMEKNRIELESYVGGLKVKAATSYSLASEKRILAQRNLEMAERLDNQTSLNDTSAVNLENQKELLKLTQEAKENSLEAQSTFELGREIEKQATITSREVNKMEAYIVKLKSAKESGNQQEATRIYKEYSVDNNVEVPESMEHNISTLIEEQEVQMKYQVKKAADIEEEQKHLQSEISRHKAAIKATKKKKQKEGLQNIIDELEVELAPLESQKMAALENANKHERKALAHNRELDAIKLVNSGGSQSIVIEEPSEDEKEALLASITATTSEIEALESSSVNNSKVLAANENEDNTSGIDPKDLIETDDESAENLNQTETDDSSSELAVSPSDGAVTETIIATGKEENDLNTEETNLTEVTEDNESANTEKEEEEYFPYTTEYEQESDEVILVEGKSVPLNITTNTGKHKYTPQELKGAEIILTESPYNDSYSSKFEENNTIEDPVTKSYNSQSINYNWLVAIEKEIAELSYAKEMSTNQAYKSRLNDKISELNTQSTQKRNFMALNARIIKQFEDSKDESVVSENVEEESNTSVNEVSSEVLNEQLIVNNEQDREVINSSEITGNESESDQESTEVEVTESVLNEDVNESTASSGTNTTEDVIAEQTTQNSELIVENGEGEITNTEIEEEAETLANKTNTEELDNEESAEKAIAEDTPATSEVKSQEVKTAEVIHMTSREAVISEIEEEKVAQETVVAEKKMAETDLAKEIEVTRKKKKRRVLEAELVNVTHEKNLEEQKLVMLKKQTQEVVSSQDVMIANPLSIRPSVAKHKEARQIQYKASDLESEIEELNVVLEGTRKKKKKRVIEAEIVNVRHELELAKMRSQMAEKTANDMEIIEVSTLKRLTSYGTEELVKIPEIQRELSTEELIQVEQITEYNTYLEERKEFDKIIESADVFYTSGSAKTEEAKRIEEEISLLNSGMELLPQEEQDSLRMLIVEKKSAQKRLLVEAEVYYHAGKELTNDAYFKLNEANSALLVMNNAEDRTMIIAAISDYKAPVVVEIDSTNIDVIPTDLAGDIFIDSDSTYYSAEKPIPVGVTLPKGVILKVQIGAFRNPIPQETFKGFAPIVGERTESGLTRYTAGLFTDFATANQAKTGIRAKGYSDAFVVAYLNGERISISEARKVLAGEISVNEIASNTNPSVQSAPANDVSVEVATVNSQPINTNNEQVQVTEVANRGSLYFTVQVGVYSSRINPSTVFSLSPLNVELIQNNLIRYSSGVYGSVGEAINARNRIVQNGISDAFVTAYSDGKRITIAEAKRLAGGGNPASFNNTTTPANTNSTTNINTNTSNSPSETGPFYVSVGPYDGSIPIDQARVILALNSLGVIVEKNNNATLYKIGNFTDRSEAEALRTGLESKGLINPTIVEVE